MSRPPPAEPPNPSPLRLLVRHSGSARDAELAEELLAHLRPLERFAGVDVWAEDRLRAGDPTRSTIDVAIDQADVALLLLSADFLGSAVLHDIEVPRLLARYQAGQLRVVPVVLRPCAWELHPWLVELHPLPKGGTPIAALAGSKRDTALAEAAREIVRIARSTAAPRSGGAAAEHSSGTTTTASVPLPSMTPAVDPASVYLSYGDADVAFAQRLYEALEAAGVPVFFRQEHALPGVKVHRSARKSIREYQHVVLLCSQKSLPAASVASELDEMLAREFDEGASERIVPVLLDDFVFQGWQPRHLDIRQTILDRVPLDMKGTDGQGAKFDKAFKRLLSALNG